MDPLVLFDAERTLTKTRITPADQAGAYFLLVSDRLSKTTGQVIAVDGVLHRSFPDGGTMIFDLLHRCVPIVATLPT